MVIAKNRIYSILFLACFSGYIWLFSNYFLGTSTAGLGIGVCFFKQITRLPCPSCGITRSILLLLNGEFSLAIFYNPLGLLVFLIMLVVPVWIVYDLIFKRSGLLRFYHQTETVLKKKQIYIPSIALVLANWAWNIYKGL